MRRTTKPLARGVNALLGFAHLKLVKDRDQDWADASTFIPFRSTLEAARREGISVGDWIDRTYNVPGSTEKAIAALAELGAFDGSVERVCEIGPGSGRYLHHVRETVSPSYYEIYETAEPWAKWLRDTYSVVLQPTDGRSLAATPDRSVDLVHAHKLMCVIPFLTIGRYMAEMMRVIGPQGVVAFDAHTDDCVTDEAMQSWLRSDVYSGTYPSLITSKLVVDMFESRGFEQLGSFFMPMKPGSTQYFAFRRR